MFYDESVPWTPARRDRFPAQRARRPAVDHDAQVKWWLYGAHPVHGSPDVTVLGEHLARQPDLGAAAGRKKPRNPRGDKVKSRGRAGSIEEDMVVALL